ncbi:uncharacterized protein LOC124364533 [Homalodisca vitripennis]|nr:uncharacterized protein LOC124364533 [Homalodisca vitripennis]XP_046676046.1 uncharacterized protein LOC124364533 [Homalodisca vitripennis]
MPVNTWFLLRIFLVIVFLSLFILLELLIERSDFDLLVPHSQTDHVDGAPPQSGFLVDTKGCRIPDLDPMDPSIQRFIYDEPPINCVEQYGPALVESNLTSLYVNLPALAYYNVSDTSQLRCCYLPFWRVEVPESASGEYPSNVDTRVKFSDKCIVFEEIATVKDEFVKVTCSLNNESIYLDYHAFTPVKRSVKKKVEFEEEENAVSVLMIGIDAVSRLNFHRQMPQTLNFLEKNLSAVEMLGYNKVEDNTFPNLIPVLTGLSTKELKKACWAKATSVFDSCNFVWDNFSDAGYETAFGEDASWMGIFSYLKSGFRKQPTDYYMNIFNKVSEDKIGFEKRLNAKLCVGPRKTIQVLLNYVYKFVNAMRNSLFFGFFWGSSLTHDYLNLPKYGDEEHRQLLENLYNEGVFNRTVLVVMSDHGIRWGEIRGTFQGYLEERLPFLFIAYPNWFRIKYTTAVANLKKNTHKLTTPYDLHETLLDLSNVAQLDQETLRERSRRLERAEPLPRGISLFLPISENRTCSSAGIDDHWCTCHQTRDILTNSSQVRRAANRLVKHINSLLLQFPQCAELRLYKIRSAREESSSFKTPSGIQYFTVTIETTPGRALFEATVRYNGNTDSFSIVGTVSRINLYGDQSSCVTQYRLRLYCYCIH